MDNSKQVVREGIAAFISLGVILVSGYFLWVLFKEAGIKDADVPAFNRMKDVLQFILPFAGAVFGYYFGRMPAERATDVALKRADEKTEAAVRTKSAALEVLNRVEAAANDAGPQAVGKMAAVSVEAEVDAGRRVLNAL